MPHHFLMQFCLLLLLCPAGPLNGFAETPQSKPRLMIELNSLTQQDKTCQVSFVMKNNLQAPLEQLSLELVLFNQQQQVQSLLLLSSTDMPDNKTSVRQYALKQIKCRNISKFLINDVKDCRGQNLTPALCLKSLVLDSRTSAKLEY